MWGLKVSQLYKWFIFIKQTLIMWFNNICDNREWSICSCNGKKGLKARESKIRLIVIIIIIILIIFSWCFFECVLHSILTSSNNDHKCYFNHFAKFSILSLSYYHVLVINKCINKLFSPLSKQTQTLSTKWLFMMNKWSVFWWCIY